MTPRQVRFARKIAVIAQCAGLGLAWWWYGWQLAVVLVVYGIYVLAWSGVNEAEGWRSKARER